MLDIHKQKYENASHISPYSQPPSHQHFPGCFVFECTMALDLPWLWEFLLHSTDAQRSCLITVSPEFTGSFHQVEVCAKEPSIPLSSQHSHGWALDGKFSFMWNPLVYVTVGRCQMLLLRVRREDNENMLCKYVCILWELDQSQEIMGLYRIFYAYVFHVLSAYACSSLIIHLYIQLKYMKFYRGWSCLTAELFFFFLVLFYWMFCWYIWCAMDEQPRWDFGVY